jgi:hypothetical protein
LEQAFGGGEAFGMFEVELERELRRVERAEELAAVDASDAVLERADQAQPVGGLVGFDVDDGGAVVGEGLGGDRADADPGEVGELDAGEGQTSIRGRAGRALPEMAGFAVGPSRSASFQDIDRVRSEIGRRGERDGRAR